MLDVLFGDLIMLAVWRNNNQRQLRFGLVFDVRKEVCVIHWELDLNLITILSPVIVSLLFVQSIKGQRFFTK